MEHEDALPARAPYTSHLTPAPSPDTILFSFFKNIFHIHIQNYINLSHLTIFAVWEGRNQQRWDGPLELLAPAILLGSVISVLVE